MLVLNALHTQSMVDEAMFVVKETRQTEKLVHTINTPLRSFSWIGQIAELQTQNYWLTSGRTINTAKINLVDLPELSPIVPKSIPILGHACQSVSVWITPQRASSELFLQSHFEQLCEVEEVALKLDLTTRPDRVTISAANTPQEQMIDVDRACATVMDERHHNILGILPCVDERHRLGSRTIDMRPLSFTVESGTELTVLDRRTLAQQLTLGKIPTLFNRELIKLRSTAAVWMNDNIAISALLSRPILNGLSIVPSVPPLVQDARALDHGVLLESVSMQQPVRRPTSAVPAVQLLEDYHLLTIPIDPAYQRFPLAKAVMMERSAALQAHTTRLVDLQSPWQYMPYRAASSRTQTPFISWSALSLLDGHMSELKWYALPDHILRSSGSNDAPTCGVLWEMNDGLPRRRRRHRRDDLSNLNRFVSIASTECALPVLPQRTNILGDRLGGARTPAHASAPPLAPPAAALPQSVPAAQADDTDSDARSATEQHVPQFSLPQLEDGNMLEQFIRLQKGQVEPPRPAPHQVTPQGKRTAAAQSEEAVESGARPPAVSPPVPLRVAAQPRISHLLAASGHTVSHVDDRSAALAVLVAESFLEDHPLTVGALQGDCGIQGIDAPLEAPVSLILDACTAACVVQHSMLADAARLKRFVKQLTGITFKFSKIVCIVALPSGTMEASENEQMSNTGLLALVQALLRFPAQIVVRQCMDTPAALAKTIESICRGCLRTIVAQDPSSAARYSSRPYLETLRTADTKHVLQCEFLQLLPTVNFFCAALLLHNTSLRQVLCSTLPVLLERFRTMHVLTEEAEIRLKAFVQVVTAHAGVAAVHV